MKLAFKDLYRAESTREEGTLKYFREKLERKNVSADVKHYEGCEQFFESIGRYYLLIKSTNINEILGVVLHENMMSSHMTITCYLHE